MWGRAGRRRRRRLGALAVGRKWPTHALCHPGCSCCLPDASRALQAPVAWLEAFRACLFEALHHPTSLTLPPTQPLLSPLCSQAFKNLDWSQFTLVFEALHERNVLLKNVPYLSNPLPIMMVRCCFFLPDCCAVLGCPRTCCPSSWYVLPSWLCWLVHRDAMQQRHRRLTIRTLATSGQACAFPTCLAASLPHLPCALLSSLTSGHLAACRSSPCTCLKRCTCPLPHAALLQVVGAALLLGRPAHV